MHKDGCGQPASDQVNEQPFQNLTLSISSRVIVSAVRSYGLVVCEDLCAALALASSRAPPLDGKFVIPVALNE